MSLEEYWKIIYDNFNPKTDIYQFFRKMICQQDLNTLPNLLLYSVRGFPIDILIDNALREKFGKFTKKELVWQKEFYYMETPYFFEIDVKHPSQSTNINQLSCFIKELIQHACIYEGRHIIIIKNIEYLFKFVNPYAFRVLLERFSKNAFFICTTYNISSLENPIKSRFLIIRFPLLKYEDIEEILINAKLKPYPKLKDDCCRNLFFATYISWVYTTNAYSVTDKFCSYRIPQIYEFFEEMPNPSLQDIREFITKISSFDVTCADMTHDLLLYIEDDNYKMDFIHKAAEIDRLCASTEGYRKPLYLEFLFQSAVYIKKQNDITKSLKNITINDKKKRGRKKKIDA